MVNITCATVLNITCAWEIKEQDRSFWADVMPRLSSHCSVHCSRTNFVTRRKGSFNSPFTSRLAAGPVSADGLVSEVAIWLVAGRCQALAILARGAGPLEGFNTERSCLLHRAPESEVLPAQVPPPS